MIEEGIKFKSFSIENWFDCGKKDVLLDTNRIMLKKSGHATRKIPVFENTIVIDPVSIAKNCDIKNAIIGPYVSIGEETKIDHSIIEESIIGTRSHIQSTVLHHSVIGSETYIKGVSQSLNIGDSTEIDFS
jgi:glucose-1-phosphate thymidylyltransferase